MVFISGGSRILNLEGLDFELRAYLRSYEEKQSYISFWSGSLSPQALPLDPPLVFIMSCRYYLVSWVGVAVGERTRRAVFCVALG